MRIELFPEEKCQVTAVQVHQTKKKVFRFTVLILHDVVEQPE